MAAPVGNWQRELEHFLKKTRIKTDCHSLRDLGQTDEQLKNLHKKKIIDGIPWITAYFENCHRLNEKSIEKGSRARKEGNQCFQKRQYKEAASYYTQAILNAPAQTQELALAYGNRSAALFHMSSHKECLTDIDEASHHGFPEQTKYKLLIRKLHCLKHLGSTQLWEKCLMEATEAIKVSDCDRKKKDQLLKEMKDLELMTLKSDITEEAETLAVPSVSHGNGSVLVQASASISLQCSDEQGRFLTACADIRAGDTLIVERPFAAVLLPEHYHTHCHHCFVKLNCSFPCRQCTMVQYCSPRCASDSWDRYHNVECPYLKLLHSVGIAHLSLRIVVVAGLDFLKEFRGQQAGRETDHHIPGLDGSGLYCRNYLTVYDLMTHAADMETDDQLQYTLTALLLLRILQHSGWFDNSSPDSSGDPNSLNHTSHANKPNTDLVATSSDKHAVHEDGVNTSAPHGGGFTQTLASGTANKCVEVNSEENKTISSKMIDSEEISNTLQVDTDKVIKSGRTVVEELSCKECDADKKDAVTGVDKNEGVTGVDKNEAVTGVDKNEGVNGVDKNEGVNWVDKPVNEDVEMYVGQLLLRHIQQLVCNAHAITELQCSQTLAGSTVEDESQVRIATAIYPTASLMNHSCDPTIISSFHKDTLVVRAVKDVPTGGEIFNCYGPHHKRMSWSERQRSLREQYFFTCQCQPCLEGETTTSVLYVGSICYRGYERPSIYRGSYKCPSCYGPLVPVKSIGYRCQECHHSTPRVDSEQVEQAAELFQRGLLLLQEHRIEDGLTVMKQCYKLRRTHLYKHNNDLSETKDCLARCFASLGRFQEAAMHLKSSVDTVKVIYGPDSIETANELQKLSEILISAQDWRQALSVTQEAVKLFTVHYGKGHTKVKEMTSAMDQLKDIIGK